jgi:hypothetical protein
MIELVEQRRAAEGEVAGTNAMGASPAAVGQPVRVPRVDGRPLDGR